MRVAHAANMIRGLMAVLLVLATLVAFAGPGFAKAVAPGAPQAFPAALDSTAVAPDPVATDGQVLSADRGVPRPCDSRGSLPSAQCPTAVPCITGGLPPNAFAVPAPAVGRDEHARAGDAPAHGITTLPDLPPPRLSA